MNHISKIFQSMKIYITSLQIISSIDPILFQVIKFLNNLSQTSIVYESFEYCCS